MERKVNERQLEDLIDSLDDLTGVVASLTNEIQKLKELMKEIEKVKEYHYHYHYPNYPYTYRYTYEPVDTAK